MEPNKLYDAMEDEQFSQPYIDLDEWRDAPVRHRYIHGGFSGTGTRFCFYFPESDVYKKRFFQKLQPIQGPEQEAQSLEGEEDIISFSILHGAYFVESNLGGVLNGGGDASILYRCSAQTAQYARKLAAEMYGTHRPYGYLFGGSGGAYKTLSCIENTTGIWDGAAPFVIGSPMALPAVYTVRAHAMRLLRNKLPQIADAIEPGGNGNPYSLLNEEEADALREATAMGFPMETWCEYKTLDAGGLPHLAPPIGIMDPTYYTDFWEKDGYLGADPKGSAVRDRIHYTTMIRDVQQPTAGTSDAAPSINEKNSYGVDEAWKHLYGNTGSLPVFILEDFPAGDVYTEGLTLRFVSGKLTGQKFDVMWQGEKAVTCKADVSGRDLSGLLAQACAGDRVEIDNSDYIAVQTYHRHQVPEPEFHAWDQYRDAMGNPVYPQRSILVSPLIALGGAGSIQQGTPSCKLIIVESLMDESAFPWQADWYRKEICKKRGTDGNDILRLWQMEHCMHTDCDASNGGDHQHIVSYFGTLYQALLDLSDWVERGKAPADTTEYSVNGGVVSVPATAKERRGVQPVVRLEAFCGSLASENGRITVKTGQTVRFKASIEIPAGSGPLEVALWDFESTDSFLPCGTVGKTVYDADGIGAVQPTAEYTFNTPGTRFPVVKAASNRNGNDPFTRIWNQARIRVIVEE